jgi:hypothetical protein
MSLSLGLLSQTESFLKAAINLISDIPSLPNPPNEACLVTSISSLTGILVLVPGHPEQGPFHLLKGLLNAKSTLYSDVTQSVPSHRVCS